MSTARVAGAPAAVVLTLVLIVIAAGGAVAAGVGSHRTTPRKPGEQQGATASQPLDVSGSTASPGSTATPAGTDIPAGGSAALTPTSPSGAVTTAAAGLPITHPQDDRLGSTICAHEACARPSDTAAQDAANRELTSPSSDAASSDASSSDASSSDPSSSGASSSDAPSADQTAQAPQPTAASSSTGGSAPVVTPTTASTVPTVPVKKSPTPPPVTSVPAPTTPAAPTTKPTVPTVPAPPRPTTPTPPPSPSVPVLSQLPGAARGFDVSSYQGNVNWTAAANNGARFVYIKSTEGTGYQNPYFVGQYNGSYRAGLVRGAYHFALPDRSSGVAQADYFVNRGGGWSADGSTLPPMLDIEYNPYGSTCYGLSHAAMSSWIRAFSNEVHSRTGRYPTIYSTRDWWNYCTGSDPSFGATNPLFVACYCSGGPGRMPAGWTRQTIWQYSDAGTYPGDQDLFNGTLADVRRFALTG